MSDELDPTVVALLREREGYVRRGLRDRLKAVDAELKRLGHKPPRASRRPKEDDVTTDPTTDLDEDLEQRDGDAPEAAVDQAPERAVPAVPEAAVQAAPERRG